jgi:hypothetical protein
MLGPDGAIKVMDFGIATVTGAAALTATGATVGTASYLSPEQVAGERGTPASDVYALGIVFYEMLAGRPPFTGENAVAVAVAHMQAEPPPLRQVAPDVPEHLAMACHRALSKDPARRPISAAAFGAMLRPADAGTASTVVQPDPILAGATQLLPPAEGTAVLPAPPGPGGSHPRRIPPRLLAVGGAVMALLFAGVALVWITGRSSPEKVAVPPVVGLDVGVATEALHRAGLQVGEEKPVDGEDGMVVDTDPAPGSEVLRGSDVTLLVGSSSDQQQGSSGPGSGDAERDGGHRGKGKGHGKGDGGGD